MANGEIVSRYHPLLVAMHWLVAILVIANLAAGLFLLDPAPNWQPEKADLLRLHMATGLTVLMLMAIRLLARALTRAPPIPHRNGALRWIARINHWALYLVVIAMLSTGLGMAQLGGLFPILQGAGVALPESFDSLPPYAGHALFSSVLAVLIALHLAGVAYHHLVRGENLLARMWFGPRYNAPVLGSESA